MAGTSNSITTKNRLVGTLNSGDNLFSGLVNTAYNPAYALVTQAGAQITLFISSVDYKMYAQLKDKYGNTIFTSNVIDLPLETMVVNARYDSTTKEVVLILDNGNELRFSVADLVEGLVSTEQLDEILNDYVTFVDYAGTAKAGVIKISDVYATATADGVLTSQSKTYIQYENLNNNAFIGKGTLENVITGKQLVNKTYVDEADSVFEEDLFGDYKVIGEGESVTLEDTAECPMKVLLKPSELYQETTTGKNFFNINATHTDLGFTYKYEYTLKPNTQYTVSSNVPNSNTANVYANGGSSSTNKVCLNVPKTITSDNDGYFYVAVRYKPVTGESDTIDMYQAILDGTYWLQVEEGSQTTNYEPYTNGVSPNPDYPQEIHSISGDNEIKVVNKNLLDLSQCTFYRCILNSDNSLTSNISNSYFCSIYADYLKSFFYEHLGDTITFSVGQTLSNKRVSITISGTRIGGQTYQEIAGTNGNNYVTGTIANDFTEITGIELRFNRTSDRQTDTTSIFTNFMLNLGETITYEPHQEQNLPLNLPVENLFDINSLIRKDYKAKNDNGIEENASVGGYTENYIKVNPNTKYIISGTISDTGSGFRLYYYDNSKNWISRTNVIYQREVPYTFTTPNDCYYIQFQYVVRYTDFNTIQIEKGTKANSYSEYGTTPLEYCKIGNYEDEFFKNTTDSEYYDENLELDKWYLKKNIWKMDLGTVDWISENNISSGQFRFNFNNSILQNIPALIYGKLLCNIFIWQEGNVSYNTLQDGKMAITNSQSSPMFRVRNSQYSSMSASDFKTAMSGILLYYQTIIPQYILLNDILQKQLENIYNHTNSYNEQTNVSQENNDLPFVLKLSAFKNTTKGNISALISENKNQEYISNKVIEINSNSTDTQYPSAKCVYDLVGNIETLLEELDSGSGV